MGRKYAMAPLAGDYHFVPKDYTIALDEVEQGRDTNQAKQEAPT